MANQPKSNRSDSDTRQPQSIEDEQIRGIADEGDEAFEGDDEEDAGQEQEGDDEEADL